MSFGRTPGSWITELSGTSGFSFMKILPTVSHKAYHSWANGRISWCPMEQRVKTELVWTIWLVRTTWADGQGSPTAHGMSWRLPALSYQTLKCITFWASASARQGAGLPVLVFYVCMKIILSSSHCDWYFGPLFAWKYQLSAYYVPRNLPGIVLKLRKTGISFLFPLRLMANTY